MGASLPSPLTASARLNTTSGRRDGQGIELREIGRKADDLGGEAERLERATDGLRGNNRVDLVGAAFRRRMHDRDEAAGARHQARFRSRSPPLRLRP